MAEEGNKQEAKAEKKAEEKPGKQAGIVEKKLEGRLEKAEKSAEEKIGKVEKKAEQKMEARHESKFAFKGELKKELNRQKQDLLAKSEISLILDTYDDIFSDFDPRPYSQRALSDDFLREARKASYEIKPGVIELRFLIPTPLRKTDLESVIRRRLREHFRKHYTIFEKEARETRNRGILLAILGFALILAATYVAPLEDSSFIFRLLFVILEPSGWFCLWFGFDNIFTFTKSRNTDLDFYKKMSRAEIIFAPY